MDGEARRRWVERAGLFALGGVGRGEPENASVGPMSAAMPLFGSLIVAVSLYILGAVALVQGGGLAAIAVGVVEISAALGVAVASWARAPAMIAFVVGLVTVVVGITVLWL